MLVCALVAVVVGAGSTLVPGAHAEPPERTAGHATWHAPAAGEPHGESVDRPTLERDTETPTAADVTAQPVPAEKAAGPGEAADRATAAAAGPGTASGLPWRSGVFSHDVDRTVGFAQARGRAVDVLAVFPTRDSWATLMDHWWMSPSAVPEGFTGTLNVGLPLFPTDGSLDVAASGVYDEQWRRMGELIASRYPDAYVRPGWEFNIPDWPWAATPDNVGVWQEAFRRAAVNLRAGGPELRIVWNPNEGHGGSLPEATLAWPGEEYVDVVAIDAYDWYPAYCGGGWEEHRTKDQGWDYWGNFARARGKRFAVPEWGVMTGSPASGGDNPEYVTAVLGWMRDNVDVMEFETYFEETEDYCRCALSQNPAAQAAYVRALDEIARTVTAETMAENRGVAPAPAEELRAAETDEADQADKTAEQSDTARAQENVSPAPAEAEIGEPDPSAPTDQVCCSCSSCASAR